MRALLILLVAATSAAGAQSPGGTAAKAPGPVPRVVSDTAKIGTYDLEVTTNDGTLIGELTIKRATQGLTADLSVGANRPAVKSFVREGDIYVLTGGHGTFTVVYKLTFARDSLAGTFAMSGGMTGTVAGAVRR